MHWIEPDGTSHNLTSGDGITALRGRIGAYMPPVAFVEDVVPLQAGSRLREVRTLPRVVDVPLIVRGSSESDLRSRIRQILGWFLPSAGDGRLRVTAADGVQRDLTCRYAGGLELSEGSETGSWWQKMVISLRAFDPYWLAANATTETYLLGTPATFFPFFPLVLTNSTIYATATVTNPGDVDAWPVWTITGPGSSLALRNTTNDTELSLSTVLSAGDVVVIDTRPGAKTVKRGSSNLFGDLSSTSELWPLTAGVNALQLEMSGATSASRVQLSYTPRYLGP